MHNFVQFGVYRKKVETGGEISQILSDRKKTIQDIKKRDDKGNKNRRKGREYEG